MQNMGVLCPHPKEPRKGESSMKQFCSSMMMKMCMPMCMCMFSCAQNSHLLSPKASAK